ncbi:MAG: hypothetical protein JST82_00660 [Bacteroidetes bacterium]|nr:hypothetical protein [Bacteroidota bacterium]
MRNFIPEYILIVVAMMAILMMTIKSLMILAFRQNIHFSEKLLRSFFFYDLDKITRTLESRLKRYYKTSNFTNIVFYSLIAGGITTYVGMYVITLADYIQPHISHLLASN